MRALYCGGTLAYEALWLLRRALGPIRSNLDGTASITDGDGHVVLYLGAEAFTTGRPHPMLDPAVRRQQLLDSVRQPEVAVILCDVILGWGAHSDPGIALAAAWQEARVLAGAAGRAVIGIATVCGTMHDSQDYERQCRVLRAQGMLLAESNAQAVRLAVAVVGAELDAAYGNQSAETPPARPAVPVCEGTTSEVPAHLPALFSHGPRVINVGLEAVLHAGPPLGWDTMCGPMRGAVLGALQFEGWAADAAAAQALIESQRIALRPCHSVSAVGPMAGIIAPSMPLMVVENREYGNRAYVTLNEGLGKVLRFGANDASVLQRLHWLQQVAAPALQAAVQRAGGVNLRVIMAQALLMGDEMHQRNIAATSLLVRALMPHLVRALLIPRLNP